VDPASGFAVDAETGAVLVPDGAGGMVAIPFGGYGMNTGMGGGAAYYGAAGWGQQQQSAGGMYDASGMFAMQGMPYDAYNAGASSFAWVDPATGMVYSEPAYGQQQVMMGDGGGGMMGGYGYSAAPDAFAYAPQQHAEMMMAAAGLYAPAPLQMYAPAMMAADGGSQYTFVAQAAGLDASSLAAMGFDPFALSYAGSMMDGDHDATAAAGAAGAGATITGTPVPGPTGGADSGPPPSYRPLARLPSMRNGFMLAQQRSLALLGPNEYGDVMVESPGAAADVTIGRQSTGGLEGSPAVHTVPLSAPIGASGANGGLDGGVGDGGLSARRRAVDTSGADDDNDDADGKQTPSDAAASGKPGGSALYNASYTFYSRAAGIRALKAAPPKLRLGAASHHAAAVVPLSAPNSSGGMGDTDADMPVVTGRSGTPRSPAGQAPASADNTGMQQLVDTPAAEAAAGCTTLEAPNPAAAPGGLLESVSVRSAPSVQPTLAWDTLTQLPDSMGAEACAIAPTVAPEGLAEVGELGNGVAAPASPGDNFSGGLRVDEAFRSFLRALLGADNVDRAGESGGHHHIVIIMAQRRRRWLATCPSRHAMPLPPTLPPSLPSSGACCRPRRGGGGHVLLAQREVLHRRPRQARGLPLRIRPAGPHPHGAGW